MSLRYVTVTILTATSDVEEDWVLASLPKREDLLVTWESCQLEPR